MTGRNPTDYRDYNNNNFPPLKPNCCNTTTTNAQELQDIITFIIYFIAEHLHKYIYLHDMWLLYTNDSWCKILLIYELERDNWRQISGLEPLNLTIIFIRIVFLHLIDYPFDCKL